LKQKHFCSVFRTQSTFDRAVIVDLMLFGKHEMVDDLALC